MEKMIDNNLTIIDENEKLIANILHDVKSPLYSIKIGLISHLDNELNQDIYETAVDTLNYIESFLVNYNFKKGKFDNKISSFDIKDLIFEKIKNFKYIFKDKNIHNDIICDKNEYKIYSIKPIISSIIGNLISNIAFHAAQNEHATIKLYREKSNICVDFQNKYIDKNNSFSLGLDFCRNLADYSKVEIKYFKTKNEIKVSLKIPSLNCRNQHLQIIQQ